MKRQYRYDFVLSFAGENRETVEEVKRVLEQNHLRVFYDFDEKEVLLGKDLAEYFSKLYQEDGEYCVMFISKHYIRKPWARWERRAALARAFISRKEYILPYYLDNSNLRSVPRTIGRARISEVSGKEFATLLVRKYYREHNSLELMDGIFIRNVEPPGKTLIAYEEGYAAELAMRFRDDEPLYGFERGVRLSFSIKNTTDRTLRFNTDTFLVKDENHCPCQWGREPYLMELDLLCKPQGYGTSDIKPHESRNFGFNICSFCWEETWESKEAGDYKQHLLKKYGPLKALSRFTEEVKDSDVAEVIKPMSMMSIDAFNKAMEKVLKSVSKDSFGIFNGVKLDICMGLSLEKNNWLHIAVETVIYENQARFMNTREVKGWAEGYAEIH